MEYKQTAVDFLLHEISEIVGIIAPDAFSAALIKLRYEQAKAIEKEQIKNAYMLGLIHPLEIEASRQSEQYYQETYGIGH